MPATKVARPPTVEEAGMRCQPVAMLHVHSTSSILNHVHVGMLGVPVPSVADTRKTSELVGKLQALSDQVTEPLLRQVTSDCRSVVFIACRDAVEPILAEFGALPYVAALVKRAVDEAKVYAENGIKVMELENVVAPYFIGPGDCPWEELVILYLCARAVRAALPDACLGVHILSCNEQEVLPIGIAVGAYFVRSEATLFEGVRPEGRTINKGNLARYLYLRRVLRQLYGDDTQSSDDELGFPQVWSDVQKKHTVWPDNLLDDAVWLNNIAFVKLEGVIITGPETGSNVPEEKLKNARAAVDKAKAFVRGTLIAGRDFAEPPLPVVTGSGGNFDMYVKYADFMIVGTAFKRGNYWENEVDVDNVKAVLARIRAAQE